MKCLSHEMARENSPGPLAWERADKGFALKGRPKSMAVFDAQSRRMTSRLHRPRQGHFRSPFQGGLVHNPFPGLKTWAVLSDHFVVRHVMPATFIQSLRDNHALSSSNRRTKNLFSTSFCVSSKAR
jgi:hypothetical protein